MNFKSIMKKALLFLVVFAVSFAGIPAGSAAAKTQNLEIAMLDVNQGDSTLIKAGSRTILVDTGEEKYYDELKTQLEELGVKHIDELFISHMDSDHMGSADFVIENFCDSATSVYVPQMTSKTNEYKEYTRAVEACGVKVKTVREGDVYKFGSKCKIEILGADMGENTNDSSVVMKFTYNKITALFTGDLSARYLDEIMEKYDVSADILKVSHHGSASNNPVLFLKAVSPKYAMIGVGADNNYGHPHKEVLTRLEKYAKNILRTDLDGTIIISGNGKKSSLKVKTKHLVDWESKKEISEDKKDPVVNYTGTIIGNRNSKVYHVDTCRSLPMEKNRVYFKSSEEAEKSGYRPCGNCH